MKNIIFVFTLLFSVSSYADQRTLESLTVDELTQIVRLIIQESLEECEVTGTMKGRAKVNLAVVGSVEAKMECSFEGISESEGN